MAPDLCAKARRVVGTFVFLIGAGVVVDLHALWTGTVAMLVGGAVLIWGLIGARPRAKAQADAPVSERRPTESLG